MFFTRCEQDVITYAALFHRFSDTLNIFRMACPRPVDELERGAKANFTLQDEVLFEKHTDFISVMVFPFKSLSLLATAIRPTAPQLAPHGCRAPAAPHPELQRGAPFEDITLINAFHANARASLSSTRGASPTLSWSSCTTTTSRSIVRHSC